MSRVAKAPVELLENVKFSLQQDGVTIEGPKGKLSQHISKMVDIQQEDNLLKFAPRKEVSQGEGWKHAGTARALVNNMINGVTNGFEKRLQLIGVGYRAQAKGKVLHLTLGFSHPIEYKLPEGVVAEVEGNTEVCLKSIDKQRLGQAAAEIRAFRPPEPYKGKGVRYKDEQIVRKETKKK
jgi:large subunit ribosomal protein L6